ncbi:hypothetical protein AVEN_183615-1, partial [Araneus ventricosus]
SESSSVRKRRCAVTSAKTAQTKFPMSALQEWKRLEMKDGHGFIRSSS